MAKRRPTGDLRERVSEILITPLPPEVAETYTPHNIPQLLMAVYVTGGAFDAAALDLLRRCAGDAAATYLPDYTTPEAKEFFRELGAILQAILAELAAPL